jgi:hypothetical protein
MIEDIEKYSYLWDGTQSGWVLVKDAEFPDETFIVNRTKGSHLHIDDPILKKSVCVRMLDAGVSVEQVD